MSDLSKYIQKELRTILNNVHTTPVKKPKKSASLQKIQSMVECAPIAENEKKSIKKSIRKIQSAMSSKPRKLTLEPTSQYAKNLFFENMVMDEQNLNTRRNPHRTTRDKNQEQQYLSLLNRLQEIKQARMRRENYLSDLIVKSQRLQRLIDLKQDNQEKYLKSKMLEESGSIRKKTERQLREKTIEAAKDNRRKTVHTLMSKYNNFIRN